MVCLPFSQPGQSQNQDVLRARSSDRGDWNPAIESHKLSGVLNRERKQENVGQLSRSMDSGRIHHVRIQQTDIVRPEFMDILVAGFGQTLNDRVNGQRVWIARIRHDADASVLRDWT